jgi:probable rRNA maturation factor
MIRVTDDRPTSAQGRLSPTIDIAVRVLDPAWRQLWPAGVRRIRGAARIAIDTAFAQRPSSIGRAAELTIVLANDSTVRGLNRDYRGIDRPTNVLSFSGLGNGRDLAVDSPAIVGDVILARETVAAEAAAQGKPLANHAVHLAVHGVLHLLGHDHRAPVEASLMESIEIRTLARLGVADPYAVRPPRRRA